MSEEGSQQSRNTHAPLPRVGDPFLSSQIQRLLGGHILNVAEVLYMHLKETDVCCLASWWEKREGRCYLPPSPMLQGLCGNEATLAATAEPQTKEVAVLLGVIVPNYCAELWLLKWMGVRKTKGQPLPWALTRCESTVKITIHVNNKLLSVPTVSISSDAHFPVSKQSLWVMVQLNIDCGWTLPDALAALSRRIKSNT